MIRQGVDSGVNFFDTGPLYGGGESEVILGEALRGISEEVTVCTKVGLQMQTKRNGSFGVKILPLTEPHIRASVESSLQKLKRDSIELLMLHAFDCETPLIETLEALTRLYQEGKIHSFGCSNFNPHQLSCLLKESRKANTPPFVAAQCHYNMIERRAGRFFADICEKNGLFIIVNRALARGALSGKYAQYQEFPEGSRAASSPRIQKWLSPEKIALLNDVEAVAKKHEVSLATIALCWLLRRHKKIVSLIGARDERQLAQCLETQKLKLDDNVFHDIEVVIERHPRVYNLPPRYLEK